MEPEAEPEDILSPELREAFGDNAVDIVLPGKKTKRPRDPAAQQDDEEVKQLAKKLSKSKRKKLAQLELKKAKEGKRDGLYQELSERALSETQLQLLVSSRQLGQHLTNKQRLVKAFKKHKAGLQLTEEEMQLLFPELGRDQLPDLQDMEAVVALPATPVPTPKPGKTGRKTARSEKATDSSADVTASPAAMATKQEKKEKGAKQTPAKPETTAATTASASSTKVSASSWAAKMMSTFSKLQQENPAPVKKRKPTNGRKLQPEPEEWENDDDDDDDDDDDEDDDDEDDDDDDEDEDEEENEEEGDDEDEDEEEEEEDDEEEDDEDEASPQQAAEEEEAAEVPPEKVYVPVPMEIPAVLRAREYNAAILNKSSSGDDVVSKSTIIQVNRDPAIQEARMQLPVCQMEQEIVEAIADNDVIVLCGETGSGKSTQVPQFLYEAGYTRGGKLIGITQPRRVAATSTALRVATELNTECGRDGFVSYQIRYDTSTLGPNTQIKFMTDGILLKEVTTDLLLRQYSVLLLDEAHERNINTDVLLGLLSRAIHLRREVAQKEQARWEQLSEEERMQYEPPLTPLKLVIMSATLRVSDFVENRKLFASPPPVLRAESRQYPVTIHFDKRTELKDYVQAAFVKVCKIHRKLPEGGILVFLTGKREILRLCEMLRQEFKVKKSRRGSGVHELRKDRTAQGDLHNGVADGGDDTFMMREMDDDEDDADFEEVVRRGTADDYDDNSSNQGDEDAGSDGGNAEWSEEEDNDKSASKEGTEKPEGDVDDEEKQQQEGADTTVTVGPIHVLPLFAMLSPADQAKVFKNPPQNHRLIVVATNVAETSITIPGIKYVVDCGRAKERVMDIASGISTYKVEWISQASADQRAGRSGRTGPGHCYRLYSSAFYNQHMKKFADAEILNRPLEDIVLQMKAIGIRDIANFPFPTSPPTSTLTSAMRLLSNLGALDKESEQIAPLGKALAHFPLNPRYAKMLILGHQSRVLDYAIALVSMLVERSPFMFTADNAEEEQEEDDEQKKAHDRSQLLVEQAAKESKKAKVRQARARWHHPESDVLARLRAAGAYAYVARPGSDPAKAREFCAENFLHEPTMSKSLELRKQLTRIANDLYRAASSTEDVAKLRYDMPPPTPSQETILRQIVAASSTDCIAKLAPLGTITVGSKMRRRCGYIACDSNVTEPLYIHSHSCLYSGDPNNLPEWVAYSNLVRSETAQVTYMTCVTAIEGPWLPKVAKDTPMLRLSKPLTSPPPYYDPVQDAILCYVSPTFGHHGWELSPIAISLAQANRGSSPSSSAAQDEYRWFARLMLSGAILPELAPLHTRGQLSESPSIITSKQPSPKVAGLVTALAQKSIASKKALEAMLRKRRDFLKAELQQWVKNDARAEFERVWSTITTRLQAKPKGAAAAVGATVTLKPAPPKSGTKSPATAASLLSKKRANEVVVVDASSKKIKKLQR